MGSRLEAKAFYLPYVPPCILRRRARVLLTKEGNDERFEVGSKQNKPKKPNKPDKPNKLDN
jgi:LPS O-antigen subunit length determinant protein (WzzB/FepE family)